MGTIENLEIVWKLDRDKTKLSCLVANSVHTADTDKTNSFVLSVMAVLTIGITVHATVNHPTCCVAAASVSIFPKAEHKRDPRPQIRLNSTAADSQTIPEH